jgi:uncharacterized protein YjdB
MNRIHFGLLTIALAVFSTPSCSDKSITDPGGIALNDSTSDAALIASASVRLARDTIGVGETTQASVTLRDYQNRLLYQRITWSSSDSSVATVSGSGLVTGVSPGSVAIIASRGRRSARAILTVTGLSTTSISVASVSVELAASSLGIGQTTQATATTRDSSNNVLTDRTVVWSSSNNSVATVSPTGAVAAIAAGVAEIMATSEGKSGQAAITVNATPPPPPPVPVATISVSPASASVQVGNTVQLSATTMDSSGNVLTGRAVTWASANSAVATVSSTGRVTAVAAGTARITATSEGKSGSATVTITAPTPAPVASVSVTLAAGSLNPGSTTQATATTRDASNNVLTGRAIVWSSSNSAVATISATGLVTAVAAGTARITATSEGQSGSASLAVQAAGSSNEPSGMTVVSDRPFNALHELGWDEPSNGQPQTNVAILADATAPKSAPNIMRITYPAGFTGGSAPWDADSPGFLYKTVYVSHWSRVSSNWEGHPGSSINKQYYLYTSTDVPSIVVVLNGSGTGPLRPFIEGQNIVAGGQGSADPQNPDWGPNLVPSAQVTRGAWFHIELVAAMNTAGNADGYLDLWLDGVHITHVGGIKFQNTPPSWRSLHLAPVWGGGGGTVTNTMHMDFDHLYFSGKN